MHPPEVQIIMNDAMYTWIFHSMTHPELRCARELNRVLFKIFRKLWLRSLYERVLLPYLYSDCLERRGQKFSRQPLIEIPADGKTRATYTMAPNSATVTDRPRDWKHFKDVCVIIQNSLQRH